MPDSPWQVAQTRYRLTSEEMNLLRETADRTKLSEIAASWGQDRRDVRRKLSRLRAKCGIHGSKSFYLLSRWIVKGKPPRINQTPGETITCIAAPEGCGLDKPREEFYFWPLDCRCRACGEGQLAGGPARNAKVDGMRLAARRTLTQILGSLEENRIDLPHIDNLVAATAGYMGGMEQLSKDYSETLIRIKQRAENSKNITDLKFCFEAQTRFLKLIQEVNAMTQESVKIEDLSKEEAQEKLADILMRKLAQNQAEEVLRAHMVDVVEEEDGEAERRTG